MKINKFIVFSTLAVIAWTFAVGLSLFLDTRTRQNQTRELALREARANFNKDFAFRHWATKHGGVYVPVTEDTQPNPNLSHVPERDITTPSGRVLTLLNPSYMVRELMEDFSDAYGIKGKITSKKPIWEGNAPDKWETRALKAFEQDVKEVYEFTEIEGEPFLRLIRPLRTTEGCLKCHGFQGYKVGDVSGGVSVSVPIAGLVSMERMAVQTLVATHALFCLVGAAGIVFGSTRINKYFSERKAAEDKYRSIFSQARDGIALISPETGHILDCNASFEEQCCRPLSVLRETKIWDIRPAWKRETAKDIFDEIVRNGEGSSSEMEFERPDGTIIPIEFVSKVIEIGREQYVQSISRDITERRQAIEKIEQSLLEKEILLREIHHRVKNNLQIIMSLLQLQSSSIADETTTRFLTESRNRVRSMALVHEKLYQSEDFTNIGIKDYIRSLAGDIASSYSLKPGRIGFLIETDGVRLGLDSLIPCGLIINELVSNSIKHGFSDGSSGTISISVKPAGGGALELKVRDNGSGLPEGFDTESSGSLGLNIVRALAQQLDGTVRITSDGGTETLIRFPV